jgi:nucleotide-binding universal stress UspA family protein
MSETIVVGTDGSDTAMRAVEEAIRLAQALGGEIHVVSAYKPLRGAKVMGSPVHPEDAIVPLSDEVVDGVLEQASAKARNSGVSAHTHALASNPAEAILKVASDVGASLIVVGNRGMHGARRVLGSVPNHVSHHAETSVLIVSTDGP